MGPQKVPRRFSPARRWAWLLGAAFATGCALERPGSRETPSRPIEPAVAVATRPVSGRIAGSSAKPGASADPMLTRAKASQDAAGMKLPPALEEASPTAGTVRRVPPSTESAAASPDNAELDALIAAGRPLDLHEAIGLAFRLQPTLRARVESIAQAKGRQEIVGSLFLPTVGVNGSVGGYQVNAGGIPVSSGLKVPAGFTFLPSTGVLPIGLHVGSAYEFVDLKLEWLITDFGRRMGRYDQARLSVDVAQLQTDRAFQAVANEVSVAYYDVLKAQALRATAQDATRRGEEQLGDARKLEREGVVEREIVLRTEVLLAEARQQLHASVEAEFVALAALNLAIGLKCGEPIRVAEPGGLPTFDRTLADCLQTAIHDRREFRVAQRMVEISQAGTRVARAEFAPRVRAGGNLIDIAQNSNSGYGDIAIGFISVDWALFEGGRRSAERRIADSRLREAMAQVESIADGIAFQVNEAYRRMNAARLGIEDARPAVEQASENYRLVRIRGAEGNATPTEITDAQASLTRAQQNYQNAQYAYLTAIARLEYAMGNGATPATLTHDHP